MGHDLQAPADSARRRIPVRGLEDHPQPEIFSHRKAVLVIIDPRPLTRDGLTTLFATLTNEYSILPVPSLQVLLEQRADVDGVGKILMLSIGARTLPDPEVRADILGLRERFKDCPTVLIGDVVDADQIMQAFQLGVKGYVPTTLNTTVAVEALRLIGAGGTFVPVNALLDALTTLEPEARKIEIPEEPVSQIDSDEPCRNTPTFTMRQMQVIGFLRKGYSNKVIAHQLQMKESTVKVHIRHIMRKLQATNRTQAALYAAKIDTSTN